MIVCFLLSLAVQTVKAEVFTFAPFAKGKGVTGEGAEITDAMGGAKLWSEPIIVNGSKTKMHLRLLKNNLSECYLTFRKHFPKASFRLSPGALLVEFKHKDGTLERIYLVEMNGLYPVIQFAMSFPNGLPRDTDEWPVELPLPAGADIQNTISLPDRNVSYGTFTTPMSKNGALSDVRGTLVSKGWTNLKEGVFIKDKPLSIMLVSFSQDDKGVTRGFVLKRPFRGEVP